MNWIIKDLLYINGWLLTFLPLVLCGRHNETSACLGLTATASSYLQNTFGTSPVLAWGNYNGRDLRICAPRSTVSRDSCCSKQHEDTFLANAFKLISRFSPKTLSDVILTQSTKMSEQVQKLLDKTMEKARYRLSSTFRVPEREYYSALTALFRNLTATLTAPSSFSSMQSSELRSVDPTERHFETFFSELFPSIFVHHLGGSAGAADVSRDFRECLKVNYNKFRPRPFLNLPTDYGRQLHPVLSAYRTLLGALRVSADLINTTTTSLPSTPCLRGLVRLRLCHLCSGQNVSRPCAGVCINVHRGCFAHLLPLRRGWAEFVKSTRRLVDVITSRQNLMEKLQLFDTTILKAIQTATYNVPTYGQQMIRECMHTADFSATDSNNQSDISQTTAETTPKAAKDVTIYDPELQPRLNVIRSLLTNNQLFYNLLPDQFCKGLRSRDCWNGTHQSPIGYSRSVRSFSDEHQRVNPEVQMQAPKSFPITEVENQNSMLLRYAKKLLKFINSKLSHKPTPPPRETVWPGVEGLPENRKQTLNGNKLLPSGTSGVEGSADGLRQSSRQNRLPEDDEDSSGNDNNRITDFSGSGNGPNDPARPFYEAVTAPNQLPNPSRAPSLGVSSTKAHNGLVRVALMFMVVHRVLLV